MRTAASVSGRVKTRSRKIAQKLILDHLIILNSNRLWKSCFYRNRIGVKGWRARRIVRIPSPKSYNWLKTYLENTKGEIITLSEGGYSFVPIPEGYLIINDRGENFNIKRFKARKNFSLFLYRLFALSVLRPAYEEYEKKEARKNSYERIVAKSKECSAKETLSFGNTRITVVHTNKMKRVEPKIIGIESQFVKKFWDGSYEDYKKFRLKVRKEGLI